jgi:rubredoxin
MKCKICGYVFDEKEKTATCQGCLTHNCKMVRCPNCGFEHLPEKKTKSKVFKFIYSLFKPSNHK